MAILLVVAAHYFVEGSGRQKCRGLRAKGGRGHRPRGKDKAGKNVPMMLLTDTIIDDLHKLANIHNESKHIGNDSRLVDFLLQVHSQSQHQRQQDCQHLHAPLSAPSCILSRQEGRSTTKEEAGHNLELTKERWRQQ